MMTRLDLWRFLRKKLLRRDILKVVWGKVVIAPLRRTPLNRLFEARDRARQHSDYLRLERFYYQRSPDIFASPGWKVRSAQLLRHKWTGPTRIKQTNGEVRVLLIDQNAGMGDWFESEWARSFDTIIFNLARHRIGFEGGERDLVAFSMGLYPELRTLLPPRFRAPFLEWRTRLQSDLLEAARLAHSERPIDLCLAYGSYQQFEPETLRAIRAMGVPVALLCLDEKHAYWERPRGIPNGQKPLIGSCDVHLTSSFECLRWYMSEGAAGFYFPQAVDPEIYQPTGVERDIPVSFVGQRYGVREERIQALRNLGIEVQCFGPGWEHGPTKDPIEVYLRSRVNLGMGETGESDRMTCIKGRDFQVPGTGSLYLTTYDPELAWLFDIGKEILCYRNEIDCAQQIRYYLANPEHAEAIAKAGRARCLAQHTWTRRLEGLLRWMGILEDGRDTGPSS